MVGSGCMQEVAGLIPGIVFMNCSKCGEVCSCAVEPAGTEIIAELSLAEATVESRGIEGTSAAACEPDAWRDELAARLNRYRSRRKAPGLDRLERRVDVGRGAQRPTVHGQQVVSGVHVDARLRERRPQPGIPVQPAVHPAEPVHAVLDLEIDQVRFRDDAVRIMTSRAGSVGCCDMLVVPRKTLVREDARPRRSEHSRSAGSRDDPAAGIS